MYVGGKARPHRIVLSAVSRVVVDGNEISEDQPVPTARVAVVNDEGTGGRKKVLVNTIKGAFEFGQPLWRELPVPRRAVTDQRSVDRLQRETPIHRRRTAPHADG